MYYYNNQQALGGKDVWHLAHDKWMSVYDTLSSEWFVEKLQDYGMFETNLSTVGIDVYYQNLISQVTDLKKEIEDNQALIIALESVDLFRQYKEMSTKEIMESIKSVFQEAGSDLDEATVKSAYQNAIQLAAMPPFATVRFALF